MSNIVIKNKNNSSEILWEQRRQFIKKLNHNICLAEDEMQTQMAFFSFLLCSLPWGYGNQLWLWNMSLGN